MQRGEHGGEQPADGAREAPSYEKSREDAEHTADDRYRNALQEGIIRSEHVMSVCRPTWRRCVMSVHTPSGLQPAHWYRCRGMRRR